MLATFSASTAYSIALASERSPVETPSAVAGGIRLPTLRSVKSAPGSVDASRSGTTRLSEHVMKSASGDWLSARSLKRWAYCGSRCSRKSTMPMMSLRMIPLLLLALALGRGRNGDRARFRVHRLYLVAYLDHLEVIRVLHLQIDDVAPWTLERDDALLGVDRDDVGQHGDFVAGRGGRSRPGLCAHYNGAGLRLRLGSLRFLELEGERLDVFYRHVIADPDLVEIPHFVPRGDVDRPFRSLERDGARRLVDGYHRCRDLGRRDHRGLPRLAHDGGVSLDGGFLGVRRGGNACHEKRERQHEKIFHLLAPFNEWWIAGCVE